MSQLCKLYKERLLWYKRSFSVFILKIVYKKILSSVCPLQVISSATGTAQRTPTKTVRNFLFFYLVTVSPLYRRLSTLPQAHQTLCDFICISPETYGSLIKLLSEVKWGVTPCCLLAKKKQFTRTFCLQSCCLNMKAESSFKSFVAVY